MPNHIQCINWNTCKTKEVGGGGRLTTGCFTDPWYFILSGARWKHTKFLQTPPKQTAHGMEQAVQRGQCRTHCN